MKAFAPFPKIGRLARGICITEKIDGTNAQIDIGLAVNEPEHEERDPAIVHTWFDETQAAQLVMRVGSRSRWIRPGKEHDNYGFAGWVEANAIELQGLGLGTHFGEWWGAGVQRRYDQPTKRFSLFNVDRWADGRQPRPACCDVVPTLYRGVYDQVQITEALTQLRDHGSVAAPGFLDPEGIVIWHEATRTLFKVTLKNDESPKGQPDA